MPGVCGFTSKNTSPLAWIIGLCLTTFLRELDPEFVGAMNAIYGCKFSSGQQFTDKSQQRFRKAI